MSYVNALIVRPGRLATEEMIDTEEMEDYFEFGDFSGVTDLTPYKDPVSIVINQRGLEMALPTSSGASTGLLANRVLWDEEGNFLAVIRGILIVVGFEKREYCSFNPDGTEKGRYLKTEYCSLNPELAEKYMEMFRDPEKIKIEQKGGKLVISSKTAERCYSVELGQIEERKEEKIERDKNYGRSNQSI